MRSWRPWSLVLGGAVAVGLAAGAVGGVAAASSGSQAPAPALAGPAGPAGGHPMLARPRRGGPGAPPAGPQGRPPAPGTAGKVTAVGASGFSLQAGATTYRVTVSTGTGYGFAPGWTAPASALAVGERVSVQGSVSGGQITARAVQIHLPVLAAQVTTQTGDTASVSQRSGRTATLQFASAPTLTPGESLQAVGRWQGDTLEVLAYRQLPAQVAGTVTAVGSGSATVQTVGGASETVAWSGTTVFRAGPGAAGGSTAVVVGARLHAVGTRSGTTLQATQIDIGPRP